ncbi:hypothetical protein SAMN03159496_05272 [Rhizobium sp. NFR07]|nr:hypothetical protein SAMN03159496_05272 [Rhizobium sp. NFR07]
MLQSSVSNSSKNTDGAPDREHVLTVMMKPRVVATAQPSHK